MTIILWDSIDAIRAVAGDDYEKAVVPDERKQVLARWDERAAHYDVAAARPWVTAER